MNDDIHVYVLLGGMMPNRTLTAVRKFEPHDFEIA
jgi:hypothetical protein